MQTGSSAWWMAVDRARERAEAANLLASPATLISCPGHDGPYLIAWRDARPGVGAAVPPIMMDSCLQQGLHRVALLRRPLLKGQMRLARRQPCVRQGGLDAEDFTMLWRCLQGRDVLAFVPARSGDVPRTVDIVPLPLHPEIALPASKALIQADLRSQFGLVPGWAFPHRVAAVSPEWLAQPEQGGRIAWVLYLRMRRALQGKRGDRDFHMLVTRRWMWLVPCPIGAALEYAGVVAVRTTEQWERMMQSGPWSALSAIAEEASLCG